MNSHGIYTAIAAALRANYAPIAFTDPVRDAIHNDYCITVAATIAANDPSLDHARFLADCGMKGY